MNINIIKLNKTAKPKHNLFKKFFKSKEKQKIIIKD